MYNPFKSRTNWLQAAIIAMAVLNAIVPFVPVSFQDALTAVLAILAIVTHTDTAVKAGATN